MVVCVAIYVHLCCYGILFCIYHIILATSHKLLSLYHHQTLSTVRFWPSGAWTAWSIQYQCNHQCVLENAEESSDAATASVPEKHHTQSYTSSTLYLHLQTQHYIMHTPAGQQKSPVQGFQHHTWAPGPWGPCWDVPTAAGGWRGPDAHLDGVEPFQQPYCSSLLQPPNDQVPLDTLQTSKSRSDDILNDFSIIMTDFFHCFSKFSAIKHVTCMSEPNDR